MRGKAISLLADMARCWGQSPRELKIQNTYRVSKISTSPKECASGFNLAAADDGGRGSRARADGRAGRRAGRRGGRSGCEGEGGNWDEDDGCGCGESRPKGAGAKVGAEAGAEPALQARGWRRAGQGRPRGQEVQDQKAGKGREVAQEGGETQPT